MTNPIHTGVDSNTSVTGTLGTGGGGTLDPDKVRQIQLLAEASLVSFTATPATLTPFGTAKLAWNIAMPNTVLSGITVEVVIEGLGGAAFTNPIITTARAQFQSNSQLKLRQDPTVDVGINSFVLSIALEAEIPDWRNANVDVTMAFSIVSQRNGLISASLNTANATVSPGPLSTILSAGCAAAVAGACESVINGFLWSSVGPTMVTMLADALNAAVAVRRDELGSKVVTTTKKVPKFDLYDFTLTNNGMTMRMCPHS